MQMTTTEHFDFNDFFRKHYQRSFLFAKSYVHDSFAAEDIASEALMALYGIMKKNEIRHPLTFLFSIIRNKSIDYLRHELVKQEVLSKMSDIGLREIRTRISTLEACNPEKIFSSEIKEIMEKALSLLSERSRTIFRMSRFDNLSVEEIASALKITPKGVEYHLTKVLKTMRENLKDYLPAFHFLCYLI